MNEYDEVVLMGRCKRLRDSILALYNNDSGAAYAAMIDMDILTQNDLKILFNGNDSYFQNAVKPPLGITPRKILDAERLKEIAAGIQRFIEADALVPEVWFEEAFEICDHMRRRSEKQEEAKRIMNAEFGVKSVRNYEPYVGNKGVKGNE